MILQPSITDTLTDPLHFTPMTLEGIDAVRRHLRVHTPQWRTCDFTVGGLFLWIDYFSYCSAVWRDTLFVRGLNEKDLSTMAFALPVGALPLRMSLDALRRYCDARGTQCLLSAVPEDALDDIALAAEVKSIEPLDDFTDYLYDLHSLASLQGKAMSKKRNHVNRFEADNPGWSLDPLGEGNIEAVREFYASLALSPDKAVSADYDRLQVIDVLRRPEVFGFEGAVLSTVTDGVVAFTLGEVMGDTLYVHIEKMRHDVAGAGEAINCFFARMMAGRHGPELRYVNREDDMGDLGLRKAKMSYHPARLLRKYNVVI